MANPKAEGFFDKKGKDDLLNRLKDFVGQRVNVEFDCGSCCKRAVGGVLAKVGWDFIELAGNITIFTMVPGVPTPWKKTARRVLIPIDRVCDVEIP